ncbi:hypothetical protein ACQJBY_008250 [Aegilops geniculata]
MFEKQPLLPMDTATEKNMNYLVKIGDDLLDKVAAKVDLYVGRYLDPGRDIDKKYLKTRHPGPRPTNDQELQRFAVLLIDERKLRLDNQKKKKKKKDQAQEATKASTFSPPPLTSTGSGSGSAATTEVKININISNCSTLTDDSK